jgi:hypothetical protein
MPAEGRTELEAAMVVGSIIHDGLVELGTMNTFKKRLV